MRTMLLIVSLIGLLTACKQKVKHNIPSFQNTPDSLITEISFTPHLWQADTVKAGSLITGTFNIYNIGKRELVIKKIQSSCDCTTVFGKKFVFLPGDSTVVNFKMRVPKKNGHFMSNVAIHANTYPYYTLFAIKGYSVSDH